MIKLAFIGPFPPPLGGISVLNNAIYTHFFNNVEFEIIGKIDTSKDKNIITLLKQINIILSRKPDVFLIQVNGSISYLRELLLINYLKLKNQKVVIHLHASIKRKKRNFPFNNTKWINQQFINDLIKRVDACIFISEHILNDFKLIINHKYQKKLQSVENFINVNDFNLNKIPDKNTNILYLGRLSIDKGIREIVGILPFFLEQYPYVIFHLAGFLNKTDLTLEETKTLEYHLNRNLRIYPPIFNEEKKVFFSKGDIFIYPSHHEVFPVTLLEAMAASLPIITTKVGINESIFKEKENCLYVNCKDSTDLKNKLILLITDKQLCGFMAKNNREKSLNYDVNLAMNKIEKILHNVVEA